MLASDEGSAGSLASEGGMTHDANAPAGRLHQTLLITDIVRSTEHLARLGDTRWRELLERHDEIVYEAVDETGGRVLTDRGDGFLMAFDTAGPAIVCAEELCVATAGLGVELRAGIHAGECELLGDRLAGMAVHVAARVGEQAGGSEVLVSSDVLKLLADEQFEFADHGVVFARQQPEAALAQTHGSVEAACRERQPGRVGPHESRCRR